MQNLKIPTMEEAKLILDEVSKLNPGPWVEHSLNVAEAAKSIADKELEYKNINSVLPNGCCLMEKRIVDVVMRYGFNEFTLDKWKASFEIQKYFEDRIGKSIYYVIPNVKELTFKMDI